MLLNISPQNCYYRGEGNSSLVISLKAERKVIRLQKHDIKDKVCSNEILKEKFQNQIDIVKNVLKPLLGQSFINCPVMVFLEKKEIELLNEIAISNRPKYRLHKVVEDRAAYSILLPDYCTLPPDLMKLSPDGPVISIELKPKQGFLLKDAYHPPSSLTSSIAKCRFCMMQFYKIKRKVLSCKSEYCPTDFFSGCPSRMRHALNMFFENPRNNLRIFKDQELIYSDEKRCELDDVLSDIFGGMKVGCYDALCGLVIDVLLKPFTQQLYEPLKIISKDFLQSCTNAYPGCSEDGSCHELPVGCILHRILRLQMLENLQITTLYELSNSLGKPEDGFCNNIGCFSRSEIPSHIGEKDQMKSETDDQYASRKVWEFLLAVIMQDCSIMIVLKRCTKSCMENTSQNIVQDSDGNPYLFSVAVTDLDAKSLAVVEKRYNETPLLIQSCSSVSV